MPNYRPALGAALVLKRPVTQNLQATRDDLFIPYWTQCRGSRRCEKIAENQKTKNALLGNQRIANANFGGFHFFHSF